MEPELTVFVTAHRRSEFVAEALGSLTEQTLPREQFEIVLSSDVESAEVDRAAARAGAQRLRPRSGHWGEWLLQALPGARGRVVCLLDDDDLFEPTKLERVVGAFRARPGLGYFHNRAAVFSAAGPSGRPRRAERKPELLGPGTLVVAPSQKGTVPWSRLFWQGAGFNQSSIAVRRDLLEETSALLADLEGGHSLALFLAAAMGAWGLEFTGDALTRYRVHGDNHSTPAGSRLLDGWNRSVADAPWIVRDAERLSRYVASHSGPPAFTSGLRSVSARSRLVLALDNTKRGRAARWLALREFATATPPQSLWSHRGLLAAAALELARPGALRATGAAGAKAN